jgi:negative regulator of sigma E activity
MNPELDEKLSALLDGELSPEQAEVLGAELARSPELAAQLAALAAVDDGLRALPSPRVPTDLRARVERQLRAEAQPRVHGGGRPRSRRFAVLGARRRWLTAAAFAAAAAAVLALVVLPRLGREETQVARTDPSAPAQAAEQAPQTKPVPEAPAPAPPAPAPAPAHEEPAAEDVALADDLPVIEVLDVLAELDELEEVGSG